MRGKPETKSVTYIGRREGTRDIYITRSVRVRGGCVEPTVRCLLLTWACARAYDIGATTMGISRVF